MAPWEPGLLGLGCHTGLVDDVGCFSKLPKSDESNIWAQKGFYVPQFPYAAQIVTAHC